MSAATSPSAMGLGSSRRSGLPWSPWARVLVLLTGLFLAPAARAAAPGQCAERCRQDEACVYGRCVVTCTPSCREGTSCAPSGECVARTVTQGRRTEAEICLEDGRETRYSESAMFVDLGGAFFTGVQLGAEWGTENAFVLRGTLMNLGIANYTVESRTEFERFEFGFGLSGGYRRYETQFGALRGFYFGGGGQYQVTQSVSDQAGYARTTHIFGAYGEFGYRWVFGSVLVGFGPSLGIRVPSIQHYASRFDGSCVETGTCPTSGSARFEGMLSFELGFMR